MGFSLKAMWTNKCPRCRIGNIFTEPFNIADPLNMPDKCSCCGQKTEPEPGFYYGAMYISYMLSSGLLLLPALLLVFYFEWTLGQAMAFTIFLAIVSYLKILRGGRSIWLHMNVSYDPLVEKKDNSHKLT